jgi:hypothetical protein
MIFANKSRQAELFGKYSQKHVNRLILDAAAQGVGAMNKQIFWKGLMAGSVAGWLFIFWGIFFPFAFGPLRFLWWIVMPTWAILHPLELAMSLPIGKEKGLAPQRVFIKTMAFGFTWWLPLKLGVFED